MRFIVPGLLLTMLAATSQATDYTSAATFDATFKCPEELPNDAARAAEVKAYIAWVHGQHPDWPVAEITGTRLYVLISHHCGKTLAAIQQTKSIH